MKKGRMALGATRRWDRRGSLAVRGERVAIAVVVERVDVIAEQLDDVEVIDRRMAELARLGMEMEEPERALTLADEVHIVPANGLPDRGQDRFDLFGLASPSAPLGEHLAGQVGQDLAEIG